MYSLKTMPTEDEVKKTIRALLVSSKSGSSPRQLMNDYKFITGKAIPHESFGYQSLMSYLSSLKDVMTVSRNRDRTLLQAVPASSTEHIAKMVSRQKPSDSGLSSTSRSSVSSVTRSSSTLSPTVVPATFKVKLETLMLSYPDGVALSSFQEAFARRFSYYFSFRNWGFNTLEETVRSIPSILRLEEDPVQKTLLVKSAGNYSTSPSDDDKSTGTTNGAKERKAAVGVRKDSSQTRKRNIPNDSLHSLESSPPRQSSINVDKASFLAELNKPSTRGRALKTTRKIPNKVIKLIEELLAANPKGIWLSRFPEEYQSHHNTALPVSSLGFSSVTHFVSSVPVCEIERPAGVGDWLVYLKGKPVPEVAQGHRFQFQAYVSETLVKKIHNMLQQHPNGIPLRDFPSVYKDVYSSELPFVEYGFLSFAELLQRVPGVDVIKPPNSMSVMVFQTTPYEEESGNGTIREKGKERNKTKKTVLPVPSSPQPSVYTLQSVRLEPKMAPVYVAYVKTPSCFTVQIIGEKTTKALEHLQEDLTQFYSGSKSDDYRIETPYIGQACCTIFNNDGIWYRAEVLEIPEPDVVTVKYIDYGNISQVPLGAIRQPKAHYLILPAQGVQCRLANLKPAGSTWSRRATQLVYNMTKDKPIVAIKTAYMKNILSVCLCDTNTTKDIHINDILVNQGLAIFCHDTQLDLQDFDGYQLEGSETVTTQKVPNVRLPEDGGNVATLPTAQASSEPPISMATSHSPTSPQDIFQIPGLQPQNVLQWNYLQQLMMLQQQQLLSQSNPAAAAMLSASGLLSPPGWTGLTRQTGFNGVPNLQAGMGNVGQTGLTGQASSVPSVPPGFGPSLTAESTKSRPASFPISTTPDVTSTSSNSISQPSIPKDLSASGSSSNFSIASTVESKSDPEIKTVSTSESDEVFYHSSQEDDKSDFEEKQDLTSGDLKESVSSLVDGCRSVAMVNGCGHVTASDQSDCRQSICSVNVPSLASTERPSNQSNKTDEEGQTNDSTKLVLSTTKNDKLLKRVTLTPSHSLSVIRHNDHAHFLSGEVSSWFWDSDLLQSMLRQVQKPVWGRLLWERQAKKLFWELRSDKVVGCFLERGQHQITIYNLDDLPLIVTTFNGPPSLCKAVKNEVDKWKTLGVEYFSPTRSSESSSKELEAEIQKMHIKRKEVISAIMDDPDSSDGPTKLVEIQKVISSLRERLASLQVDSVCVEPSPPTLLEQEVPHLSPVLKHVSENVPRPSSCDSKQHLSLSNDVPRPSSCDSKQHLSLSKDVPCPSSCDSKQHLSLSNDVPRPSSCDSKQHLSLSNDVPRPLSCDSKQHLSLSNDVPRPSSCDSKQHLSLSNDVPRPSQTDEDQMDTSDSGGELNVQEASDSGVVFGESERQEELALTLTLGVSCRDEVQSNSSTTHSPPPSSHSQRGSSVSASSTGFESLPAKENESQRHDKFQFPSKEVKVQTDANFEPQEHKDDRDSDCSSWDSWFEQDVLKTNKNLRSTLPIASSDVDLAGGDFPDKSFECDLGRGSFLDGVDTEKWESADEKSDFGDIPGKFSDADSGKGDFQNEPSIETVDVPGSNIELGTENICDKGLELKSEGCEKECDVSEYVIEDSWHERSLSSEESSDPESSKEQEGVDHTLAQSGDKKLASESVDEPLCEDSNVADRSDCLETSHGVNQDSQDEMENQEKDSSVVSSKEHTHEILQEQTEEQVLVSEVQKDSTPPTHVPEKIVQQSPSSTSFGPMHTFQQMTLSANSNPILIGEPMVQQSPPITNSNSMHFGEQIVPRPLPSTHTSIKPIRIGEPIVQQSLPSAISNPMHVREPTVQQSTPSRQPRDQTLSSELCRRETLINIQNRAQTVYHNEGNIIDSTVFLNSKARPFSPIQKLPPRFVRAPVPIELANKGGILPTPIQFDGRRVTATSPVNVYSPTEGRKTLVQEGVLGAPPRYLPPVRLVKTPPALPSHVPMSPPMMLSPSVPFNPYQPQVYYPSSLVYRPIPQGIPFESTPNQHHPLYMEPMAYPQQQLMYNSPLVPQQYVPHQYTGGPPSPYGTAETVTSPPGFEAQRRLSETIPKPPGISQVQSAVIQNGSSPRQPPLRRRRSSAVPIRGPHVTKETDSKGSMSIQTPKTTCPPNTTRETNALPMTFDLDTPRSQSTLTRRSSGSESATRLSPVRKSMQPLTPKGSPTETSLSNGTPIPVVPVTSSSSLGTPLAGGRSHSVGLGRGRSTGQRSEGTYAKRSARSIGLGRGLSPGLPRERRPGGMSSS